MIAMTAEKPMGGTGVAYLWSKLTAWVGAGFAPKTHTHDAATATSAGLMSAEDKAKLDKIAYILGIDDTGVYVEEIEEG